MSVPLVRGNGWKPLVRACHSVDEGDTRGSWKVEPGTIVFHDHTTEVDLSADTVQVGQLLRITATTFGDGCTRAAGMSAEVDGLRAVLTPLDSIYVPGPGEGCTDQLKFLDHRSEVVFGTSGEARVVIQGVRESSRVDDSEDVQVENVVAIVVRAPGR